MANKKTLKCQVCECALDKKEAQFVDEDAFTYASQAPEGFVPGIYCLSCFDAQIGPALDAYNAKLELAKNVTVFSVAQHKESRFLRRIHKPLTVENCADRDEALMRLAFLAVDADKNCIVDVDFSSIKIHNGKWHTSRWSGRAIPVNIHNR